MRQRSFLRTCGSVGRTFDSSASPCVKPLYVNLFPVLGMPCVRQGTGLQQLSMHRCTNPNGLVFKFKQTQEYHLAQYFTFDNGGGDGNTISILRNDLDHFSVN